MDTIPAPGSANLREAYEAAFTAPYASHRWRSIRCRRYWADLESRQDALAGPLSCLVEHGNCEYVYAREDEYFAGVADPEGLRRRLLEWHAALAAAVERFRPTTPSQIDDLAYMRRLIADMRDLVEQACAVERARWAGEGRSRAP